MVQSMSSEGAVNGLRSDRSSCRVAVRELPIHNPRKIRVACIGAGYAGLMLAHKVKHEMKMEGFIDLCIYEKNHDVGGTWLENRYPGVACDVPAHIYTFSFEPNPDWSSFYTSGPEIWRYIRRTATKYNLDEHVQLNTKVESTIWDEASAKWLITVNQNGTTSQDSADVLVNGSGILNKWRWPGIAGLHDFKGELLHSARWDPDFDWTGKSVAVIGNGSSGIQIVPHIQKAAKHVTNYIRAATWVTANFCAEHAREDGKNFLYTEEEKRKFREHPEILHKMRKEIEHSFNQFFFVFLKDSKLQEQVQKEIKLQMQERLGHDPELTRNLIPHWEVGCRRITPGEGYLEALILHNVTPEFRGIEQVTEHGIRTTDGEETPFDAIVCATGFDVSFSPSWKLVGRDSRMLAKEWKDEPEAYLGICAAGMPNYFMFNGPNCPVGHGSLLAVMEWTAEYILRWCKKIASEDIRTVCVHDEVVNEYNAYSQEFLKRTVWSGGCRSWYKNGKTDGPVTAMYAGSFLHYKENLEQARGEDFHISYRSRNRFRYMGNGLTDRELNGEDLAMYLDK